MPEDGKSDAIGRRPVGSANEGMDEGNCNTGAAELLHSERLAV